MVTRRYPDPAFDHAPVTTARERAAWGRHAEQAIGYAGLRAGGARRAVVELLVKQDCCLSARGIRSAQVAAPGATPGMASVYRALDALTDLHLVHKVDLGGAVARYEPAHPDGEHHHHAVCRDCGAVVAIEDDALEWAVHRLADRIAYQVVAHDITLHGRCAACAAGKTPRRSR